jgi:hypothetical protein
VKVSFTAEFIDMLEPEDGLPFPYNSHGQDDMDMQAADTNEETDNQEPGEHWQEDQEAGDGIGNEDNNADGNEDDEQEEDDDNEHENDEEEDSDEEEEDEDFAMEDEAADEGEEGNENPGLQRVIINSLDQLQFYNRHEHSLDFGPDLHVTDRIRLWRRGNTRGFEFYPTGTLLYIWRLNKLVQGLNPADFAHEEPPVPDPGNYQGW